MAQESATVAAAALGAPAPRLMLLGAFDLECGGECIPLPLPAQRLLAFLALHGRALLRGYVAGSLWLDSTDDRAAGSLRSALWRLRRPGPSLVDAVGDRLRLASEISVDVREATACARGVLDSGAEIGEPPAALLAGGEILPDWYDDWLVIERERFRQLRVHALERLCDRLTAAGRFAEAVDAGLAAVESEPLRESAHRALVRMHLAEGNRSEALRQYRSFRDLLRRELGLPPSELMEELVRGLTVP